MRCVLCHRLCWNALCKNCMQWISIIPRVRIIGDVRIYSLFDYAEIQSLIKSKYSIVGSRVLRHLARMAAQFFAAQDFLLGNFRGVGIDDMPRGGYSHTAIIAHAFEQYAHIKALYGRIYAQSIVRYAGRNIDFRRSNPRNFTTTLTPSDACDGIILYDDVVTSGTTILEAANLLKKHHIPFCCAIALASPIGHVYE